MSNTPRIEIVEIATGQVVRTVPLSSAADRLVESVMRGALINLDRTAFFVREVLS